MTPPSGTFSLIGMSLSVASVVVASGGPAAVEALLALRDLAGTRVQLACVAPDRDLVIRAYEVLTPFPRARSIAIRWHRSPQNLTSSWYATLWPVSTRKPARSRFARARGDGMTR